MVIQGADPKCQSLGKTLEGEATDGFIQINRSIIFTSNYAKFSHSEGEVAAWLFDITIHPDLLKISPTLLSRISSLEHILDSYFLEYAT